MIKNVKYRFHGTYTQDGAGVRLKRIFGGPEAARITDPFLLLDHFGSNKIEDYISGFPWHPHRGIETVTYLLEGKVNHEDSEGHRGTIYPSDLQWMTAGSGIFHQEMPKPLDEKDRRELLRLTGMPTSVVGLQLWINLPSTKKMSKPTYRDIKGSSVPQTESDDNAKIKVIAGNYMGTEGFLSGHPLKPIYLDVMMNPESTLSMDIEHGFNSMVYVLSGSITTGSGMEQSLDAGDIGVYTKEGENVTINSSEEGSRFIFLSGKPINEPVAWYGPIVMNSQEEISEALLDLKHNTFIREKEPDIL